MSGGASSSNVYNWTLRPYRGAQYWGQALPNTLSFNVTEQCNIRCTYCYFTGGYGGNRKHNSSFIGSGDITAALKLFFAGQERNKHPACVYFFGGEPLLALQEIEYALAECRSESFDASFSIASNGMLLDRPRADFLSSVPMYLAVSLDGPRHDIHRLGARGQATRAIVEDRLAWLHENYKEYYRQYVSLSCVVTPETCLHDLFTYFMERPFLRDAIHWDFDLILGGSTKDSNWQTLEGAILQLIDWYLHFVTCDQNEINEDGLWQYFFASGFNIIHRTFWTAATIPFPAAGSALPDHLGTSTPPGFGMVTVRPGGDIYAGNERQKASYRLGSCTGGINELLQRHMAERLSEVIGQIGCSACSAAPLCTLTLSDFDLDDFNKEEPCMQVLDRYESRCRLERLCIAAFRSRIASFTFAQKRNFADFLEAELEALP